MEIIKNINELNSRMKSPIDNDEFIDLAFKVCYPPTSAGSKFSENFDYNLNEKNKNIEFYFRTNFNFMKLKAKIMYKSLKEKSDKEVPDKQKLLNYYKKIIDLSYEEFNKIISNPNDTKLKFYKKSLDKNFLSTSWYYFKSHQCNPYRAEQIHKKDINHRLYLSMDVSELYKFTYELVSKLEEKNMPYNFKVLLNPKMQPQQNDMFVLYVDNDDNLLKYINIINELLDNNKQYQNALHEPSPHLFSIDKRIGYGFEPKNGDSYSNEFGEITQAAKKIASNQTLEQLIGLMKKQNCVSAYGSTIAEYEEALENDTAISVIKTKISQQNNFRKKYTKNFYKIIREKFKEISGGREINSVLEDDKVFGD